MVRGPTNTGCIESHERMLYRDRVNELMSLYWLKLLNAMDENITSILLSKLEGLKERLGEFQKQITEVTGTEEDLNSLVNQLAKYDNLWLGEWGNENFNVYRHKDTAYVFDHDFILKDIEKKTKANFQSIADKIISTKKSAEVIKEYIEIEFAGFANDSFLIAESRIIEKIEKLKWGYNVQQTITFLRPPNLILNDISILNKGSIATPPHIHVKAELFHLVSVMSALKEFLKLNKKLISSVEVKLLPAGRNSNPEFRSSYFLQLLIDNFHTVAKQLESRHSQRDTLNVNDEYDVQDLMYALLKIGFKDVRKEDNLPSFAGSNTRVDFVLKSEGTLIEAKMARKGLKDKEIGNELMLDILRYGQSSEYNRLICFIYDPKSYVTNPRGLEADLQKLSTEEFFIEVYIRP
jgi:hypothetical protein